MRDPRVVFCEEEYPLLVGALTLYSGDRDLAVELAQEALAQACQHWSRVSQMDAPGAWVHRVAINLANSTFRRRRLERKAIRASGDASVVVSADAWDNDTDLRTAIAQLPRRQRTAVVLRYYADLSTAETANIMRCAEGTVRALTSQGLSRLRVIYGTQAQEDLNAH